MLREQPLFGIGIGQYALWSAHFSTPEMVDYYARENAHNYFAQIAGELGVIGPRRVRGGARSRLCWVAARRADRPSNPSSAAARRRSRRLHPDVARRSPACSCLKWRIRSGSRWGSCRACCRLRRGYRGLALIVGRPAVRGSCSVDPASCDEQERRIDFTRVTYGMSNGVMDGHARFFVASDRSHVRIPLRARDATSDAPVTLDIFVDDRLASTVTSEMTAGRMSRSP